MPIYSHSRLSAFEQCRLKFKFRYIDKIEPDFKETIESFLGKQVHKTLEWVYNNSGDLELDDVIKNFIESWNNELDPNIKIIKEGQTIEIFFNKGIKFLIDYFLKNSPFKDNTIATEKRIFINLDFEGKYRLMGFIDRVVHNRDTNIFEIHDYKTGAIKSQNELDKDRQLALYSIAIRENFDNVEEVDLIWHFLGHNKVIKSRRTLEQLENLKKEIKELIDKIESTQDFYPKTGPLCNWCGYQSKCPAFQEYKGQTKFNK